MLNYVLRVNALSCLVFGGIFVLLAGPVAQILGNPPTFLIQIIGFVLLSNAAMLMWASTFASPSKLLVSFFILGDLIWVITSLLLILAGLWITTPLGILMSIAVALFVGGCGILQWRYLPN